MPSLDEQRLSAIFKDGDILVFDLVQRVMNHLRPKWRGSSEMKQVPFLGGKGAVTIPSYHFLLSSRARNDREELALLIAHLNGLDGIQFHSFESNRFEKYLLKKM
ncbi:MAG: hypothetical protein RJA61_59 [Candidatus Parcubacteria bacterium]|jgi:hypothetical protein